MTVTGARWLEGFARQLGVDPPGQEEIEGILALAGTAAHASDRTAAPVACWMSARAGLSPSQAREAALKVVVDDPELG